MGYSYEWRMNPAKCPIPPLRELPPEIVSQIAEAYFVYDRACDNARQTLDETIDKLLESNINRSVLIGYKICFAEYNLVRNKLL